MARPEKRKRSRSEDQVPSKKPESSDTFDRPCNFSPEFYDGLSKVWLTPRALRELNRRNESLAPARRTVDQISIEDLALVTKTGGSDLARFARTGGPDLSDLQGVGLRSSAYDANFEQHLIDHDIYPPLYDFSDDRRPPKPANWEEIRQVLKVPRGSLSPSLIPESAFEDFQRKNKIKSEGTIMRNVVPLLAGTANIPNEGQLPFTNLDSLTSNTTVNPVPDFFDGARGGDLDRKVREDLNRIIIPSKKAGVPVVPNFFLEAKSSGGTVEVADGQAVLDGAHGAIIMHTLQNYLREEPVHDGDDDVWLEGTGAFRILRLFAKDWRDRFIKDANARSHRQNAGAAAAEDDLARTVEEQQAGGSSPLDFYDCQTFAEPEGDDDDLETQETQETSVGLSILDQINGKDDVDNVDVAADFATSFASSFTSVSHEDPLLSQRPPKLPRTPPSPSSTRAKKR